MCKAFLGMGGVVEKRLVIINHENVTSPAGLELTMASHKRVKFRVNRVVAVKNLFRQRAAQMLLALLDNILHGLGQIFV